MADRFKSEAYRSCRSGSVADSDITVLEVCTFRRQVARNPFRLTNGRFDCADPFHHSSWLD